MKAGSGSNVSLKRGRYIFKRRIPLDLRDVLGTGEITRPLGTKVRREAERLARAYGVLGEPAKAETALARAAALVRDLPEDAPERTQLEQARRALPPSP